jgi:hypothetical protein
VASKEAEDAGRDHHGVTEARGAHGSLQVSKRGAIIFQVWYDPRRPILMTAKRAALYSGGALLLIAWLASAASLSRETSDDQPPPRPVETSGTASLAAEVQAQTLKLKNRLASAPVPQKPTRNPFVFGTKPEAAPRVSRSPQPAAVPVPDTPPVPAIELIGVAEQKTAERVSRTAIISALSGELFLVKEGDTVAARYRVAGVGADAVELIDLASGEARRLALREEH